MKQRKGMKNSWTNYFDERGVLVDEKKISENKEVQPKTGWQELNQLI